MNEYYVSVAAKFCAHQGLRALLIDKDRVPSEKPCSGIQFPFFVKIERTRDSNGAAPARR